MVPRAATPSMAQIPTRSDAPVVRNLRRGAAADAALAVTTLGMSALITALVNDRVARSGIRPSASLVKSWVSFHTLAFAGSVVLVPPLPITAGILQAVGALYKSGGYRSFANYLSAAKAMHIEAGHD